MRLKFFCERQPWSRKIDLFIGGDGITNDLVSIAQPLQFRQEAAEKVVNNDRPVVSLSQEDAQALVDELWHCGVRPSEGTGSAGQLAATQKHLDDMRDLAFFAIKKDR